MILETSRSEAPSVTRERMGRSRETGVARFHPGDARFARPKFRGEIDSESLRQAADLSNVELAFAGENF
jgi:hypothetical protein